MVQDNVVVGIVYLSVALFCLPLHLVIIFIFTSNAEFRKLASYQIMTHIGVVDCLQLLVHILGGLANAGWIAMIMMVLVLALNRLEVVGEIRIISCATSTKMYTMLTFLSWMIGVAFFCCYLTPHTGMKYNHRNFYWSLEGEENITEALSDAETYSTIPALAIALLIYAKKALISTKKILSNQEIRILLQALIICGCIVLEICCWHWGDHFLPNSFYTPIVINTMWILENGALNPTLYLIMNKSIRRKFVDIVSFSKNYQLFVSANSVPTPISQNR
ncbi:hypothetical protein QR680_018008 [Steinernema hermaphroditum]|uniref:7TM GPCR serpentine receptor class x (Srx) domain-containing protein n=1 Tax=Steinernema hermaphroditum TaxID=289476 RepID=A0AA39HGK1_9BILA|nr:hypothetical protein QR680_018008 [Steinernema hermaphroditum]